MSDLDDRVAIQQQMQATQAAATATANLNQAIAANYTAATSLISTASTRIAADNNPSDATLLANMGAQVSTPPVQSPRTRQTYA